MKFSAIIALLATSASAFAPSPKSTTKSTQLQSSIQGRFTVDNIPGALPPVGIFDPLGLGAKADEPTLKRYREAELVST